MHTRRAQLTGWYRRRRVHRRQNERCIDVKACEAVRQRYRGKIAEPESTNCNVSQVFQPNSTVKTEARRGRL